MEFVLDLKKSVTENANYYYQKSKKTRKKREGAQKALQETLRKIKALKEKKVLAEMKLEQKEKAPAKKEKEQWYGRFRHFFSSDNFLIIGGKDSTSNEVIIKKHLDREDLVFHAQIQGAPFFVIKNSPPQEIPPTTLEETAQAAASYSKAWKLGLGSCDVYYVKPEQVSKKAPSGEYLKKGTFMISGKKNWLRSTELKIGVGVKFNKGTKVAAGPLSAIESQCSYWVVIKPGYKKSKELAQEIKEKILEKALTREREKIKKISLDAIQHWIPGGKGMIAK
jgi:predicted ribosome quality control (RQC) complex YloA/Tae2 family protein